MPNSTRAAQLADLIRDLLATWIHTDFPGYFVSVTGVTLSPDLQRATAWLHAARPEDKPVLLAVRNRARQYNQRLHHSVKRRALPLVDFREDYQEEDAQHVDDLLTQ